MKVLVKNFDKTLLFSALIGILLVACNGDLKSEKINSNGKYVIGCLDLYSFSPNDFLKYSGDTDQILFDEKEKIFKKRSLILLS